MIRTNLLDVGAVVVAARMILTGLAGVEVVAAAVDEGYHLWEAGAPCPDSLA